MLTKNQIRRILEDIASKHYMIHSFGYAKQWDLTEHTVDKINYPIMWVVPMGHEVTQGQIIHSYQIGIFDLVQKGKGNQMEVESDTFKILSDVIALLNNQKLYPSITLDRRSLNIAEVEHEKFPDEVTGHACIARLKVNYNADSCAVPGEGFGEDNLPTLFLNDYYENYISSKSIGFEPFTGDNIPMFFAKKQLRVLQVNEVLVGGSGTFTYNIYYAEAKNEPSPSKVWAVDRVVSSYANDETRDFDNIVIPKDNWVWIQVSDKTGLISVINVTMFFNNKIN